MGYPHIQYQKKIKNLFKEKKFLSCGCGCGYRIKVRIGDYKNIRKYLINQEEYYARGHSPNCGFKKGHKMFVGSENPRWKGGPESSYSCEICSRLVKRKVYPRQRNRNRKKCLKCVLAEKTLFKGEASNKETKRALDTLYRMGIKNLRTVPTDIKLCVIHYNRACKFIAKRSGKKVYKPTGLTTGMKWSKR